MDTEEVEVKQHYVIVTVGREGRVEKVQVPRSLRGRVNVVVRDLRALDEGQCDPLEHLPLDYLRGELSVERMSCNG